MISLSAIAKNKPTCDQVLKSCEVYVKELEQLNSELKKENAFLKEAVLEQKEPVLPSWAWLLIGAAAGSLIVTISLGK